VRVAAPGRGILAARLHPRSPAHAMPFVCTRCQRDVETQGLFCPFCGTAAPQPDAAPGDPYVGRTIADKYFVNGLIGSGGMGQVYKATHITLDRLVALKMLNKSFLSDASMVQRFHREARAASKLNHPNCISIQDFGQTEDGALYIAMEYLAGRSLATLLAEEFPLGEVRVVRIVGQILAALAEAHAAGIVHRDLKLANVMVEARRDEPDFVKVLDFGIAKLSEPGGGGQLTGTGIVCGTPGYMSPEQARGEELDARSDLYAVGVILYELLTGRLPFESETPMGFVAKHMTEIPIPPSARRPDVPISAGLDEIVIRTLAKRRDERPASAEDLRELLFRCELSPEAAPPSASGHASTVVLHAMTPAPPFAPPRASPPPSAVQRPPGGADASGARSGSGAHRAVPPSGHHAPEPTQQSGPYAAPPSPSPTGGGTLVTGGRTPSPRAPASVRPRASTPPPERAIAPTELTPAPRADPPGGERAPLAAHVAREAAPAGRGAGA
jgi:eukaryotic-like serine/threonine-protein kinase